MTKTLTFGALCLIFFILSAGCGRELTLPDADSPPALLYMSKCSLCHKPFHPQSHTYTGWVKTVSKMEKKAETLGIRPLLSGEERAAILTYLQKHASRGF